MTDTVTVSRELFEALANAAAEWRGELAFSVECDELGVDVSARDSLDELDAQLSAAHLIIHGEPCGRP